MKYNQLKIIGDPLQTETPTKLKKNSFVGSIHIGFPFTYESLTYMLLPGSSIKKSSDVFQ